MNQKENSINSFTTLIDCHVHIYDNYNLKNFFDSAFRNFSYHSKKLSYKDNFASILFLTEGDDYNYFRRFIDEPELYSGKINYKIERTSEEFSLKISDNNNYIILIAGQQIVTKENLEVLALGTRKRFGYGKNISDTIKLINDSDAVPVIPWGAGKWIGKRKKIVKELIDKRSDFFLGDNANRPIFWNMSSLFRLAEKKGIYNLPGSDPLNFESEIVKPGSFGFYLKEKIDIDFPFKDFKRKIMLNKETFCTYGKPEQPLKFLRNQITIQINKKLRKQKIN